jgi:hypothetical protein
LVWPEADERSAGRIARCCPRIRLLQSQSFSNSTQPLEADIAVALDAPALQGVLIFFAFAFAFALLWYVQRCTR